MRNNMHFRPHIEDDSKRIHNVFAWSLEASIMIGSAPEDSDSTDEPVLTKSQLQHFFDIKFEMADRDHDGRLTVAELSTFLRFVTHPDLRSLRAWDRFRQQ
jgi:hypothetical protein